jgi:tRNA dimethylallyltransferase
MKNPTKQKSVLLIAGPTASGKSALAMAQAKARNGMIINADSMQVYRELRILTARPTTAEEAKVPHRLYGHVGGAEDYSVARWLADVRAEIEACWSEDKLPIICGGTGLYFMALEKGLATVPPIDPAIREKWRIYEGDLHQELLKRDPAASEKLNASDRQRLVRALEVIDSTGKSLSAWQAEAQFTSILKDVSVERQYMRVPRAELYARAERRFDQMLEQGALDEVKALPILDPAMPLMKAIGVPQLRGYIAGESSLSEAASMSKTATRQYIKRQSTWARGQMNDWAEVHPEFGTP